MAEGENTANKTAMTDEERMVLCEKMDKELDEFIDGLEKKRYTEGWSEDTWEEEMEKHPFFMKSTPDAEMSPLAEGLAKLKYDPEENTPLDLANSYKEDGNFNFKHKNYRMAILAYTEGIKVKCDNAVVNASLYNNRAAAHFQLKNYRSALNDSQRALELSSSHSKARIRAAKSAYESAKYDTCMEYCLKVLETQDNREVADLLIMAKRKKLIQERDQRKKKRQEEKAAQNYDEVIKAIKERKIRVWKCLTADDITITKLETGIPVGDEAMVKMVAGKLYWPLLFLYPEFQQSDFCRACPEDAVLMDELEQVFPCPWDTANQYSSTSVNVYYEGYEMLPHMVNTKLKLSEIMTQEFYLLKAGTPAFVIVPRDSAAEKAFLDSYY